MNKHTPLPDLKFGVFMCTCCDAVLAHNDLIVDDYGSTCCPHTGNAVTAYGWNENALKGWTTTRDNDEFGWCLECGDSYLPEYAVTDNYGDLACENDGHVLVDYEIAYTDDCHYCHYNGCCNE